MDQNRVGGRSHHRSRTVAWSVHTEDSRIRTLLDEIFADQLAPSDETGIHFDIRSTGESAHLTLALDGHETTHAPAQLIDHLVGLLNEAVVDADTGTLDLHASAMTDPDTEMTVIATAPSGGGKTTLAAHLCRAGWSYLSDETVGIDLGDGSLVGCGKPLTVKDGLHATLDVDLAPLTIGPESQQRWYVRPELLGGTLAMTAPPPTDLVFIEFDVEATTELHQLPPHHALLRLLSNTYRLDRLGERALPTLARLVATARTWELRTNDGAAATQALRAAASERPLPAHNVLRQVAVDPSRSTSGPTPAPGTTFAGFAEWGAVVHDHVRSEAVLLDPIGAMVWQLLDGSASLHELTNELAGHFDVSASTIAGDVQALCHELKAQGFLEAPEGGRNF